MRVYETNGIIVKPALPFSFMQKVMCHNMRMKQSAQSKCLSVFTLARYLLSVLHNFFRKISLNQI